MIERLCRRDAGYRLIVGDEAPDHTVIARFRQRHARRMKSVFLQVLELCHDAGLIRLGLVALDGTKVKANAALDANRTASVEEQIGRMLAEAEAADAREDRQFGAESGSPALPADMKRRGDRLARLTACREKLANRAAAAAVRQQEKIAARDMEEKATCATSSAAAASGGSTPPSTTCANCTGSLSTAREIKETAGRRPGRWPDPSPVGGRHPVSERARLPAARHRGFSDSL